MFGGRLFILLAAQTVPSLSFSANVFFTHVLTREGAPPVIRVTYTNCPATCAEWLRTNPASSHDDKYGFDVENVPGGQGFENEGKVATVQLAVADNKDECLLFQVTGDEVPECLKAVLEDPAVAKVGCAINDDALDLFSDFGVEINSRVDLGGLSGSRRTRVGLKNLTQALLQVEMGKSKKIMLSDWSLPLSDDQVFYAGLDAWAGAACYEACGVGWPAAFSREKVRALLEGEMPVSEVRMRQAGRAKRRSSANSAPSHNGEERHGAKRRCCMSDSSFARS